jgi:hypothetical protein
VLNEAAEHGGPFVFMARIVFSKAVHGETPPPIGNPEGKKGHQWGKRKLARGQVGDQNKKAPPPAEADSGASRQVRATEADPGTVLIIRIVFLHFLVRRIAVNRRACGMFAVPGRHHPVVSGS